MFVFVSENVSGLGAAQGVDFVVVITRREESDGDDRDMTFFLCHSL